MKLKESMGTTIRRMRDDDVACQMVMRYMRDFAAINERHSSRAKLVLGMANRVLDENRLPQTIGEWISVVLHYGHMHPVLEMRTQAAEAAQASYVQAERWLVMVDEAHANHSKR